MLHRTHERRSYESFTKILWLTQFFNLFFYTVAWTWILIVTKLIPFNLKLVWQRSHKPIEMNICLYISQVWGYWLCKSKIISLRSERTTIFWCYVLINPNCDLLHEYDGVSSTSKIHTKNFPPLYRFANPKVASHKSPSLTRNYRLLVIHISLYGRNFTRYIRLHYKRDKNSISFDIQLNGRFSM